MPSITQLEGKKRHNSPQRKEGAQCKKASLAVSLKLHKTKLRKTVSNHKRTFIGTVVSLSQTELYKEKWYRDNQRAHRGLLHILMPFYVIMTLFWIKTIMLRLLYILSSHSFSLSTLTVALFYRPSSLRPDCMLGLKGPLNK